MSNLSDEKPTACSGDIMRRTDSHVICNNKISVVRTGDQYIRAPMINTAQVTVPDSDPRWGVDWCVEANANDAIVTKSGDCMVTEDIQNDIVQE